MLRGLSSSSSFFLVSFDEKTLNKFKSFARTSKICHGFVQRWKRDEFNRQVDSRQSKTKPREIRSQNELSFQTTEEKSKDAELRLDSSRETRRPSFCPSSISTESSDICRICHCEGTIDEPLISPCYCLGTMKYLHQTCLQRWIKSSGIRSCELCKFEFIMHSEVKPFKQVFSLHR